MPKTDYTACKPDHRMMRVEMTPKMREIAEQIAALQAQYRKLEEAGRAAPRRDAVLE